MVLAEDNAYAHAHGSAAVSAGPTAMATSNAAPLSHTRSKLGVHQNQHAQDAIEIEEDGRERKRVAHR